MLLMTSVKADEEMSGRGGRDMVRLMLVTQPVLGIGATLTASELT